MSDKLNMFGRSHSVVGEASSDLILRTRGKVRIQYGTKFIDLIKDGKINVDSKFIYKQNEVGTRDGIYVTGDKVTLVAGGTPIDIVGEAGTTYVSFLAQQETTPDQKYTALTNIGLIASTQDDINITSGIVYVESEKKLYIINNGNMEEFKVNFPNPFPEQFIISKNDPKQGAILINGTGKENSLAFNGLLIYTDPNSIINSDNPLSINVLDKKQLEIGFFQSEFYNDVIADTFKCANERFKLYYQNGESTLEVDNLKVTNKSSDLKAINNEQWFSTSNIISNIEVKNIKEDSEESSEDELFSNFYITLNQSNLFNINDILITFRQEERTYLEDETDEESDDYTIIELIPIYFKVLSKENNVIEVESTELLQEDWINGLTTIYKISPGDPIRIKNNNLDIIEYPNNIKTRVGDLSEIGYTGSGIYTDNFILKDLGNLNELLNNINQKLEDLTNRIVDLENN